MSEKTNMSVSIGFQSSHKLNLIIDCVTRNEIKYSLYLILQQTFITYQLNKYLICADLK